MTKGEACLWKYVLKSGQLEGHKFRRQRPILDYIVDFVCLDLKLVIEVDGITHTHEHSVEKDELRDKQLKEIGFSVIRLDDDFVLNQIERVREYLLEWIDENRK